VTPAAIDSRPGVRKANRENSDCNDDSPLVSVPFKLTPRGPFFHSLDSVGEGNIRPNLLNERFSQIHDHEPSRYDAEFALKNVGQFDYARHSTPHRTSVCQFGPMEMRVVISGEARCMPPLPCPVKSCQHHGNTLGLYSEQDRCRCARYQSSEKGSFALPLRSAAQYASGYRPRRPAWAFDNGDVYFGEVLRRDETQRMITS
jgi:hypothetical protein